uniref:Uncharacterized protein n=1 Tax=Arundo donax TaxID=35708 RepID=A0A0A8ZXT2_ARUDO
MARTQATTKVLNNLLTSSGV